MDSDHLDPTEESLRDADAAGRVRARLLLALGAVAIAWVFVNGLLLYDQLPGRMPTHFGARGLPNAYGAKSVFSVFGLLIVGAVILVAVTLLRQRPLWYSFPGKERAAALPPEQQSHVYAPLQESLAWLGAGEALAMALFSRQIWAASLQERQGVSMLVVLAPVAIGLAAIIAGAVAASRRLRALEARVTKR